MVVQKTYLGKRASLPSFYLPLVCAALALAFIAAIDASNDMLVVAVQFSTLVSLLLAVSDLRAVWEGKGVVGRLLITGGCFYWFWIEAWELSRSDPAFPARELLYPYFSNTVPNDIVGRGIVCVNLFTVGALLGWGRIALPRRLIAQLADRVDPGSSRLFDWANLGLACSGWIPLAIAFNGDLVAAFNALLGMRSGSAIGAMLSTGIFQHAHLLGVFGAALAVARVLMNAPGSSGLRILAIAITLPLVLFSSTRFVSGYMALPALLMLLIRSPRQLGQWNRKRVTAVVVAVLAGALILVQGAARNTGFMEFIGQDIEEEGSVTSKGFYGHEHFSAMLMAIDIVEREERHFLEPMLPYFFTHFVPSAIWENKPYPQSWQYYNDTITQGHAFNVTPSVTGQYYMNWGYPGVFFVGGLLGWYARIGEVWLARIDSQRQMLSATVCGLFLAFIFLSFRMLYPLYFAYPLFGFIAYRMLSKPLPGGLIWKAGQGRLR